MNRRWLMVGIFVGAAIVSGIAIYVFLPRPQPRPQQAFNLEFALDPSKMGSVVWVNDSGKACKLTIAGSHEIVTMNMTVFLPDGPQPQGPNIMNAPFAIKKVTLERDGKKVETDLNITVAPGATCEIHVGADDQIKPIEKAPEKKSAP